MLKKLRLLVKMGRCLLADQIIDQNDYQLEYNKIAATYPFWTDRMGKHVDHILLEQYLPQKDNLQVLDLACGRGYITQRLLEINPTIKVTGVDISKEMIHYCNATVQNHRAIFLVADAYDFLNTTTEKYDAIYCGWALPYLNHKELFTGFNRVLKKDGIVGIISNSKGTLTGIEEIFLEVMADYVDQVERIMDIRFKLPAGRKGLVDWLKKYQFTPVIMGSGEEIVCYETPQELYDWLFKTGALAGTGQIFREQQQIRDVIIQKIGERKEKDGKYEINHKFVYGIFQKGE